MVAIISVPKVSAVRGPIIKAVQVRPSWGAMWEEIEYLQPILGLWCPGASKSRATFRYHFSGEIKREDKDDYDSYPRLAFNGQYVRVVADGVPQWTGIFRHEQYDMHGRKDVGAGAAPPQGIEDLTAYGLESILDRRPIRGAWTEDADPKKPPIWIDWTPHFNERKRYGARQGGGRGLEGNMSATLGPDQVRLFGATHPGPWSHFDIVEYLIFYYANCAAGSRRLIPGPRWMLGGQTDALKEIYSTLSFEGLTVYQALQKLIPKERGLGWRIVMDEDIQEPTIHVYTAAGEAIETPYISIPANSDQVVLDVEDEIGVGQYVTEIDSSPEYDKVIFEGARMKSCFTLRYSASLPTMNNLVLAEDETEYRSVAAMADKTDAQKNDDYRRTHRFDRVYRFFGPGVGWNWKTSDNQVVAPVLAPGGALDTNHMQSIFATPRPFLRFIPFCKPAAVNDATVAKYGADREYLEPMVVVKDVANRYHLVEREHGDDRISMQVRQADDEMAVWVKPVINHVLGKNHFVDTGSGTQDPGSEHQTIYDWQEMQITVNVETDARLRVEREITIARPRPAPEVPRELVIQVPDAEYWYVVPGTMMGIDKDGALITHAGGIVRGGDDLKRLNALADFAAAWYGRPRQAATISRKGLISGVSPGTYLKGIIAGGVAKELNTVVSQVSWDWEHDVTTIRSDLVEMNLSTVGDIPGMSDFRSVGRQFHKVHAELKEVEGRIGNLPDRFPVRSRQVLRFFDDYVQIKQDDPAVNQYGSSDFKFKDAWNETAGSEEVQWQLFLKFARPVNRLRFLGLVVSQLQQEAAWSYDDGFDGSFDLTSFVQVSLIRVPLAVGATPENEYALDKLTWNNSYFKTSHMSGGASALYATADNFRSIVYPKLSGGTHGLFSPAATGGITFVEEARVAGMWFDNFSDPSYPLMDFANDGPFYGLHIFVNPVCRGGFFTNPNATTWAFVKAEIDAASGLGSTANVRRPFAMVAGLGAVGGS